MKTLDAWFETYIPQSWMLCHILTEWWSRGRSWTWLRMPFWWGNCIPSGAQWPLMPQPQVLSHKTGDYYTCLECVKTGFKWGKPWPTFLQLENITDLESFKCPKKTLKGQPTESDFCNLVTQKHEEGERACFLLAGGFDLEIVPQIQRSRITDERFCFASKKSKTTRECFRAHPSLHLIFLPSFVYLNVLITSPICQINHCILGNAHLPMIRIRWDPVLTTWVNHH